MTKEIVKYLRDAHALEAESLELLVAGSMLTELPPLADAFARHLTQTREHQRMVDARLDQLGSRPARLEAGALRVGGLNLGGFFKAQPGTPIKMAGFAYAFEALEIGAYELLSRTAARGGDGPTAALAKDILIQERAAAQVIVGTWDAAVDTALDQQLA